MTKIRKNDYVEAAHPFLISLIDELDLPVSATDRFLAIP